MHAMTAVEADELWSLIETDVDAKKILLDHSTDVASGEDLNAHMLQGISELAGAENALQKVIVSSSFWRRIDQKAGAVKGIQSLLTESFQLSVHTQGIAVETTNIQDV